MAGPVVGNLNEDDTGAPSPYVRRCPHCNTYASESLAICPSCDGTLPFVIPSDQYKQGRRTLRRRLLHRR
jgi:hypothetical protein